MATVKERSPEVHLFIELPPERVDVNVHPTKAEVRFLDQGLVHEVLRRALADALGAGPAPELRLQAPIAPSPCRQCRCCQVCCGPTRHSIRSDGGRSTRRAEATRAPMACRVRTRWRRDSLATSDRALRDVGMTGIGSDAWAPALPR